LNEQLPLKLIFKLNLGPNHQSLEHTDGTRNHEQKVESDAHMVGLRLVRQAVRKYNYNYESSHYHYGSNH